MKGICPSLGSRLACSGLSNANQHKRRLGANILSTEIIEQLQLISIINANWPDIVVWKRIKSPCLSITVRMVSAPRPAGCAALHPTCCKSKAAGLTEATADQRCATLG